MKHKIRLTALVVITTLLSGCFLKSVHPLVKEEESIVVPGLEGIWDGGTERWTFARSEEYLPLNIGLDELDITFHDSRNDTSSDADDLYGYLVIFEEFQGEVTDSSLFLAHFVELNNNLFLDLYPVELDRTTLYFHHFVPVHTFARVELEGDSLDISLFKDSWIEEQINDNRVRIKHEKTDWGILITASTSELQKFVTKFGDMKEAYDSPSSLTRAGNEDQ
ncbi:MAG: hypothetical protein WD022_08460 [Balneolaceae bacterium]